MAPQQSPLRTWRHEPGTPGLAPLPKNWNVWPSGAVIVPRPNTPPGVVPSPERRSASGRTPLRPTRPGMSIAGALPGAAVVDEEVDVGRRARRRDDHDLAGRGGHARRRRAAALRRRGRRSPRRRVPQIPSAPPVCGPTTPSTTSPRARWKAMTARYVIVAEAPSTGPEL